MTFPSIQHLLLEVWLSLGLKQFQSNTRDKFASGNMALDNLGVTFSVPHETNSPDAAADDILKNLEELANHASVELHTRTYEADARRCFGYYLPTFAPERYAMPRFGR